MRTLTGLLLCLALPASAQTFRARGVNLFDASVRCPLAGVGPRGDHACNRIALDDENSTATLDAAAHQIVIANDHDYAHKEIVGDVLLMGTATSSTGEQVPVAAHLFIRKHHHGFDAKVHAHAVTTGALRDVKLDGYTVVLKDGEKSITAMTPADAIKAISKPDWSARVAGELVEIRDNLRGHPSRRTPGLVSDITLAVGLGPAAKDIMRAKLVAPGIEKAKTAADLFKSGTWELQFTALSSLIPEDVFRRDLFLYGIESNPVAAGLKAKGLEKGQTLVFAMKEGKGTLRVGEASAPLEGADDVARRFLEQQFLGTILEHQVEGAVATK